MLAKLLGESLDLHRKIIKSPNVHLRSSDKSLYCISASSSGMMLRTKIESTDKIARCCIDLMALSSLTKGTEDLSLVVENGNLKVAGNRIKGEIPSLSEELPIFPKVESSSLSEEDATWFYNIIPKVVLTGLDRGGCYSVKCSSEGGWQISCIDPIHGLVPLVRERAILPFL